LAMAANFWRVSSIPRRCLFSQRYHPTIYDTDADKDSSRITWRQRHSEGATTGKAPDFLVNEGLDRQFGRHFILRIISLGEVERSMRATRPTAMDRAGRLLPGRARSALAETPAGMDPQRVETTVASYGCGGSWQGTGAEAFLRGLRANPGVTNSCSSWVGSVRTSPRQRPRAEFWELALQNWTSAKRSDKSESAGLLRLLNNLAMVERERNHYPGDSLLYSSRRSPEPDRIQAWIVTRDNGPPSRWCAAVDRRLARPR